MQLTDAVAKNIIYKLIKGENYRTEIIALIDAQFLQYTIDFFKRIVDAKLKNGDVTIDWYKKELLHADLTKTEICIHSGLNMKTINNVYHSTKKEIVLEAALEHYDTLYNLIDSLIEKGEDINIELTIKFRGVSVDLDINESLIVINTLAVKRAALRGGAWSTAGKQVEKPLMKTLCKLFKVPEKHYVVTKEPKSLREVDFYLIGPDDHHYRCEVKLMGRGNPESADVIHARTTQVFAADTLSNINIEQLDENNVEWVELRHVDGYKRFKTVLDHLGIPYQEFEGDIDKSLEKIFDDIFDTSTITLDYSEVPNVLDH